MLDQVGPFSIEQLRSVLPEGRDEQFNRFVSFFQESGKEWHQRPFVDGFPTYKDYVGGHVGLVIRVQPNGASEVDRPALDIRCVLIAAEK